MKIKELLILIVKILILLALVSFVFYHLFGLVAKVYQERQTNVKLKEEIKLLKEEQNSLENGIKALSDPNYIEREARIKLNFKKEGEEVVFFVSKEEKERMDKNLDKKKYNQNIDNAKNGILNNFRKWLDVIFD